MSWTRQFLTAFHLRSLHPAGRRTCRPDLLEHARLARGAAPCIWNSTPGGDVERLNLIIVDQLPDQRWVQLGTCQTGTNLEPSAQLPLAGTQVVNALDAIARVTNVERRKGGEVAGGAGFAALSMPDCLQ